MNRPRPARALRTALTVALVAAAACSSGEEVGNSELLEFEEQEGARVGEIEATTTAPPTVAPTTVPPATTAAPTATTAAAAPTTAAPTTARPAPSFTIRIVSTGQGFDPFNFSVSRGTRLTVVNEDSQARTFTSDQPGAFDSGMIPPGGSFVYVASTAGTFNFHDETRPFAVGQMEVTP